MVNPDKIAMISDVSSIATSLIFADRCQASALYSMPLLIEASTNVHGVISGVFQNVRGNQNRNLCWLVLWNHGFL